MIITVLILVICMCLGAAITCIFFKRTIDALETENTTLAADLKGQKIARREQTRKYDELYEQFLHLTQYNSEMAKEVQSYKNTYEEAADEVYALFLQGKSRQEICQLFPRVAYSTICTWIIRKRREAAEPIDPATSKQQSLI